MTIGLGGACLGMFTVFENWTDAPFGVRAEATVICPGLTFEVLLIHRQRRASVYTYQNSRCCQPVQPGRRERGPSGLVRVTPCSKLVDRVLLGPSRQCHDQ